MYFKFRGIDSRDMGVTVLRRPNIISPETRTWTTFIDGKDGAYSHPMGLKPNSFNFTIAVEDVENIDKVLGWLTGRGRFIRSDLPNRYLNVHINEGVRLHRTVEWLYQGEVTVQVVDPFWYSVKDEWQEYKPNLIKNGWDDFVPYGTEGKETKAPLEVFEKGYRRNIISTGIRYNSENEYEIRELTGEEYKGQPVYKYTKKTGGTPPTVLRSSIAIGIGETVTLQVLTKTMSKIERANSFAGLYHNNSFLALTAVVDEVDGWDINRLVYTNTGKEEIKNVYLYYYPASGAGSVTKMTCPALYLGEFTSTKFYRDWESIPEEHKTVRAWDNMAVHITPLENGLTRIQTWGGKSRIKINSPTVGFGLGTATLFAKNNGDPFQIINAYDSAGQSDYLDKGESGMISFTNERKRMYVANRKASDNLDFIASDPYIIEGNETILANEGNYPSKPIIKLVKGEGKSVTIKTKEGFLTYTFPNRETEVELDTQTKSASYNGQTRDRFVETNYVELTFPPGPIDMQVEGGTAYFKKKDRWI